MGCFNIVAMHMPMTNYGDDDDDNENHDDDDDGNGDEDHNDYGDDYGDGDGLMTTFVMIVMTMYFKSNN